MHQSSYDKMTRFKENYLAGEKGKNLCIMDIGSQDVNGSYKDIFNEPGWSYKGVDLEAGKNVDIVLSDPYDWAGIKTGSVDVVVSGQAIEHVEYFWITMLEVERVLKPGGICCVIAPAGGYEHRYPVDCWRFYPDGFVALTKFARMELVDVNAQWESENYADDSDVWKDCVLVARKNRRRLLDRIRLRLRNEIIKRII